MPRMVSPPVIVRPASSSVDLGAHADEEIAQGVACLVVARGQPGTRTRPPLVIASIRKGAALDRSGSITTSVARIGEGLTDQVLGPPCLDRDAVLAQARQGHLDVGEGGHRRSLVLHGHALVVRRAGEQQRGDELARRRRVDDHPAAAHAAGARDGERQRAAPSVVDAHPQSAQRIEDPGHRSGARVRVAVEGDRCRRPAQRRAGRTASRCRRGRSRRCRRAAHPGSPSSPRPRCRPSSRGWTGQRPSARCRASAGHVVRRRDRRPAQPAPGRGWSATSSRAARRARPRQRARPAQATGPDRCSGASPRPEAISRATWRRAWPRAWPRGPRCLTSRRTPVAACFARHATPGRPSVSTAARSSPPSIERFLKKWMLLVGLGVGVGLVPELVAGHRRRQQRGGQHGAGQPRRATAGEGHGRDDLRDGVDPDERDGVLGDLHLRGRLLEHRPQPVGHRLRLDGERGRVLQRLHSTDHERGREQGTGDQASGCHGYINTRSAGAQPAASGGDGGGVGSRLVLAQRTCLLARWLGGLGLAACPWTGALYPVGAGATGFEGDRLRSRWPRTSKRQEAPCARCR